MSSVLATYYARTNERTDGHTPEHFVVETQVEADALSTALFIRGGDGGELAVPRLTALVPTGHLINAHAAITRDTHTRLSASPDELNTQSGHTQTHTH